MDVWCAIRFGKAIQLIRPRLPLNVILSFNSKSSPLFSLFILHSFDVNIITLFFLFSFLYMCLQPTGMFIGVNVKMTDKQTYEHNLISAQLLQREYKKGLEQDIKGKGMLALATDTPDFLRAKNATDILSQVHRWSSTHQFSIPSTTVIASTFQQYIDCWLICFSRPSTSRMLSMTEPHTPQSLTPLTSSTLSRSGTLWARYEGCFFEEKCLLLVYWYEFTYF